MEIKWIHKRAMCVYAWKFGLEEIAGKKTLVIKMEQNFRKGNYPDEPLSDFVLKWLNDSLNGTWDSEGVDGLNEVSGRIHPIHCKLSSRSNTQENTFGRKLNFIDILFQRPEKEVEGVESKDQYQVIPVRQVNDVHWSSKHQLSFYKGDEAMMEMGLHVATLSSVNFRDNDDLEVVEADQFAGLWPLPESPKPVQPESRNKNKWHFDHYFNKPDDSVPMKDARDLAHAIQEFYPELHPLQLKTAVGNTGHTIGNHIGQHRAVMFHTFAPLPYLVESKNQYYVQLPAIDDFSHWECEVVMSAKEVTRALEKIGMKSAIFAQILLFRIWDDNNKTVDANEGKKLRTFEAKGPGITWATFDSDEKVRYSVNMAYYRIYYPVLKS